MLEAVIGAWVVAVACAALAGYAWWHMRKYHSRPKRPDSYEIGGKKFFPVKVTMPVMEAYIDAAYEPPPPEEGAGIAGLGGMVFGIGVRPGKEDQKGYTRAAYAQLSILLRDSEGKPPDVELLGLYLDVAEAQNMVREILPG